MSACCRFARPDSCVSEQLRQLAAQLASLAPMEDAAALGVQTLFDVPLGSASPLPAVGHARAHLSRRPLLIAPTAALALRPQLAASALRASTPSVLRAGAADRLCLPPGRQVRGVPQASATPNGRCGVRFLRQAAIRVAMWACCDDTTSDDEHNTDDAALLLFDHALVAPVLLSGLSATDELLVALTCRFASPLRRAHRSTLRWRIWAELFRLLPTARVDVSPGLRVSLARPT